MGQNTGISQHVIRLQGMAKRGELSDLEMNKAVTMLQGIVDTPASEECSTRDKVNAAKALAAIHKMAMDATIKCIEIERLDAGKATANIGEVTIHVPPPRVLGEGA